MRVAVNEEEKRFLGTNSQEVHYRYTKNYKKTFVFVFKSSQTAGRYVDNVIMFIALYKLLCEEIHKFWDERIHQELGGNHKDLAEIQFH